jgi:hypothetical protein
MHTITIDLRTPVAPERVLAAVVDFSPRRSDVFKAVQAKHFELHELGTTTADVTEGTRSGPMYNWERCDYDWSTPGVVVARVTDSNIYALTGSYWEVRATPDGNGSTVRMIWAREFRRSPKGRFLNVVFKRFGQRLFTNYAKETLANIERLDAAA